MLKAIGRLFKAVYYLITFRFNDAADTFLNRPEIMGARYDEIIVDKRHRLNEYVSAVSALKVQEEKKKVKIKQLAIELENDKDVMADILGEAKLLMSELGDGEDIETNPDYISLMNEYKDYASTAEQKEIRIEDLGVAMKKITDSISQHKLGLEQLQRDLENLKIEKASAVAEMISSKEEEKLAKVIAGMSEDSSEQELEKLRDVRAEQRADAEISRELAGMDVKQKRNRRIARSRENKHAQEFSQLVGLAKKSDDSTKTEKVKKKRTKKTKLPE
ncbi:hypothetical protein KAJ27_05340 [bacterium]|nr:hypothetical protein [bacterium]